ncbi:MAG: hypothetical protein PHH68_04080 [Candidatus Omnitrophica bacterium]|jgi:chromosome segregation ATPase|nr:hypothetical protein [Candidatus Omnitrophota bacterium]MDD5079487.1 hypothetical protein [Candidatus Omnitrophota bacterium]
MKNRIVFVLIAVNVLFLAGMVHSYSKSRRTKIARDKEMFIRFDAQEKAYSLQKENSALENKLKKAEDALKSAKTGFDSVQKSLEQERKINQDLRAGIEKLTGLKDSLEEQLKDATAVKAGRQPKK